MTASNPVDPLTPGPESPAPAPAVPPPLPPSARGEGPIGASVLPDDGIPVARPYVPEPAAEDPAAELQAMAWAASVARKRRGPRADERWGVGTVLRVALGCLFLLIACALVVGTLESPTEAVIALVFGLLLAATGATNIVAAITGWKSAIPVVLNVVLGALFFVAIFLRFASLL